MNAILLRALFAPLSSAAIAAVVTLWAWRGRKLNDHPACRRCGYDLSGHPSYAGRCSECGADLSRRRARRIGVRAPRIGVATISVIVFMGAAAFACMRGVNVLRGLAAHDKPNWWLLVDANHTAPAVRTVALDELVIRSRADALTPRQERELIDRLLVAQPYSAAHRWGRGWSEALMRSRQKGRVTNVQWEQFWRQMLRFPSRVRPGVARGDPIPIQIDTDVIRRSSPETSLLIVHRMTRLTVGGIDCQHPKVEGAQRFMPGYAIQNGHSSALIQLPRDVVNELPDGTTRIGMRLEVTVSDLPHDRRNARELVRFDLEVQSEFELLAPGESSVQLIDDPEMREEMRRSISLTKPLKVSPAGSDLQRITFAIRCTASKSRPKCLFGVILRNRACEQRLTSLRSGDTADYAQYVHASDPTTDFHLVLRPEPGEAAKTLDVMSIWGEEIVLRAPVTAEK
jgi:hypothetical protein